MSALAPLTRQLEASARFAELAPLIAAIHARYHYDFSGYSPASFARRVDRALGLLGYANVTELTGALESDAKVFGALLPQLTVAVTEMFRDPEYFRVFREQIVPELRRKSRVRLWVAGCASGEEAYSFAIILSEEGLLDRSLIYATDIGIHALARAREGVYPIDRLAAYSESHRRTGARHSLSEHYRAQRHAAIFERSLREHVVFSDHCLAKDDVFAEVELVSCRNVMLYFGDELRVRAVRLFERALIEPGFLGLGLRERLPRALEPNPFVDFARREHWYKKS
jgi:chemotaxis protein methyltransferase CheR